MTDIMKGISPLPWNGARDINNLTGFSIWDTDGDFIADTTMRDNRYIVHACNLYPELVEALEYLLPCAKPTIANHFDLIRFRATLAKCKAGA